MIKVGNDGGDKGNMTFNREITIRLDFSSIAGRHSTHLQFAHSGLGASTSMEI